MRPAATLEVHSSSGNLLFTVTVSETEAAPIQPIQLKPAGNNSNGRAHTVSQPGSDKTSQIQGSATPIDPSVRVSLMTDSQKRLLFRLLADQGTEGEEAHSRLKLLFQVNTLKEVTKLEASRAIEKLLDDSKGGRPSHAAA